MARETLSRALEREHHEIDAAIEAYATSPDPASLRSTLDGLRRHIYLEEEYLFPPLRDGGLLGPIFVMLREHGELWDAMAQIDTLLATDQDASAPCRELLARLATHNSKEEPIVYPEVDKIAQADAVLELLATATMPDGWVCEQATGSAAAPANKKPRSLPF